MFAFGSLSRKKLFNTLLSRIFNSMVLLSLLVTNFGLTVEPAKAMSEAKDRNAFPSLPVEIQPQSASCQTSGDLVVANGVSCSLDAGSYTFNSILVQAGGSLVIKGNTSLNQGVTINVTSLTVESGGSVNADGQGYPASTGPGVGPDGGQAAGGGHGGQGGNGNGTSVGGVIYGDVYNPNTLGSGGGHGWNGGIGGAGGGAIRLIVSDTLSLNGVLSTNGNNGNSFYGAGGGGAGGSIWVTANTLNGNGTIQANGGDGANSYGAAGGGGGGRIALMCPPRTIYSVAQLAPMGAGAISMAVQAAYIGPPQTVW